MPPRRRYDYTRTVRGECGHDCSIWPTITSVGGSNPRVVCDLCDTWVPVKKNDEQLALFSVE